MTHLVKWPGIRLGQPLIRMCIVGLLVVGEEAMGSSPRIKKRASFGRVWRFRLFPIGVEQKDTICDGLAGGKKNTNLGWSSFEEVLLPRAQLTLKKHAKF